MLRVCWAASRVRQLLLFYRMYHFLQSSKLKVFDVWSNYEIASPLVKQQKEERTATLLACLGADPLEIVGGLNFANGDEHKDIDVVLEKSEVFCVDKTNET